MRIGDVSRPRRFADPARLRWYAFHRMVRFAGRMLQAPAVVEDEGRFAGRILTAANRGAFCSLQVRAPGSFQPTNASVR